MARRRRRSGSGARLPACVEAEGAALRLSRRRDQPRPGQDQRHLLAHAHAAHFRSPLQVRPAGPADHHPAAHRCSDARGLGRLPHLDHAHPARHLLHGRPRLQGQAPRARGAGLRLQLQALRRPGQPQPGLVEHGRRRLCRPRSAAQRGDGAQEAVRLRQGGRRRARARPLHPPDQARRVEAALHRELRRQRSLRRGGARGGRVLRGPDRRAPGRHGPVQARAVAAQLVHRAREEPRLPRDALRRRARRRRRRRPGAAGPLRGPAIADDRSRRDLDHRGRPAALAFVPGRRGRLHRARGVRVHQQRHAQRQGCAQSGQARHSWLPTGRARDHAHPFQHGKPRRGRLPAGRRGAAPRHRPRNGHGARGQTIAQGAGDRVPVADHPLHRKLRPLAPHRVRRLRPGPRQGPARRLRLCRPRR